MDAEEYRLPITVVRVTRHADDPRGPFLVRTRDGAASFLLPRSRLPLFVKRTMEAKPQAYFTAVVDGGAVFYDREVHDAAW